MSPTGAPLGIDILAIEAAFRLYSIPHTEHLGLFNKINIIYEEIVDIIKPPKQEVKE